MNALSAFAFLLFAQASPSPIADIPQIGTFLDEYRLTATMEKVSVVRASDGRRLDVAVGDPLATPGPTFAGYLAGHEATGRQLGAAVSTAVLGIDGSVQVQVYEGGAVVRESATGRTFTLVHGRRQRPPAGVALPANPQTPVVVFDWVGGYTPPRKSSAPTFTIRADGLATLFDPFGKLPTVQKRLTPDQLADLMNFIVGQQKALELDSKRLAAAVAKGPRILDAGTSVLRITTADKTHEVRCFAAVPYAEALPNAAELQRFAAIERRLTEEMDRLRPPPMP